MATESKVTGAHSLPPAIKAGVGCGLLVALLGLWPTPLAACLGLAGVGGASYYVTRHTLTSRSAATWTAGLLLGGVAGLVNAGAQLAYLLSGSPGGRATLWLWPATLGAWVSMTALRLLLLAALGGFGSWLAVWRAAGSDQ